MTTTIPHMPEASAPASAVDRPGLQPGDRLGRYVVIEEVGSGGMGRVYRAYDPQLERPVAVKLLRLDKLDPRQGESHARLLREAQANLLAVRPGSARVSCVVRIVGPPRAAQTPGGDCFH